MPLKGDIHYSFGSGGNVLTVAEPFGASLSFNYNLAGEHTQVSNSFGGAESLAYGADGNLTSLNYAGGASTAAFSFTCNLAGQQTGETTYNNDNPLAATVSDLMDAEGNPRSIVDTNQARAVMVCYA